MGDATASLLLITDLATGDVMSSADDVRELLLMSRALPDGQQAFELVSEAVRVADSLGDTYWGLATRAEMMRQARSLLRTRDLAASFTWTLAKYDEDPAAYSDFNPIYEFRWVVSLLSNFPTITIEKRDELLAEMSSRYEQAGWSQHPVHEVRMAIAEDFADPQMATSARAALLKHPNDYEMEYTVQEREIAYWVFMGDDEQAVRQGKEFIENPQHEAYLNPQMCATLLLPLLRLGKEEVAEEIEPRVRRSTLAKADRVYFWPSGSLMVYWALTSARRPERISAGVSLFERFLHVISEFSDPLTQTHFYLDSLPLLHRLATMDEPLAIRLPAAVDVDCGGESTVDAEALLEWVTERAEDLTRQFDARNGNDYFQQRLAGRMKL